MGGDFQSATLSKCQLRKGFFIGALVFIVFTKNYRPNYYKI